MPTCVGLSRQGMWALLAVLALCAAAQEVSGQVPIQRTVTREYMVFVGGESIPPDKSISSKEVTVHVGGVLAHPEDGATAREVVFSSVSPAPPDPVDITVTVAPDESFVEVSWADYANAEVEQGDIAYYEVYVNGTRFTDVTGMTPAAVLSVETFSFDYALSMPMDVWFAVVAVDYFGNRETVVEPRGYFPIRSLASRELLVFSGGLPRTPEDGLTTREIVVSAVDPAPPPSVELTVIPAPDESFVTLNWDGYPELATGDVNYYEVYVSTAYFSDITGMTPYLIVPLGTHSYDFTGLLPGQDYFFAVVAVDYLGNRNVMVGVSGYYPVARSVVTREVFTFVGGVTPSPEHGTASREVVLVSVDSAPPDKIMDLVTSDPGNGESLLLDWTSYDEELQGDVALYRVYASLTYFNDIAGMSPIATVPLGTQQTLVAPFPVATLAFFAVVAVDYLGNFDPQVSVASGFFEGLPPPELEFQPSSLAVQALEGEETTFAAFLGTPDDIPAPYQISTNQSWLAPVTSTGFAPGFVTLTVDATALTAGSYSASVLASSPGYLSANLAVAVTVQASAGGSTFLVASPAAVFFQAELDGSTVSAPVTVFAVPPGAMASFSTSDTASWLEVTPANATTPASLTVTGDPTGLLPGSHTGNVLLDGGAGVVAPSVFVRMTIPCYALDALSCQQNPGTGEVTIEWTPEGTFLTILVYRNGALIATLPGDAVSATDVPPGPGSYVYTVSGRCGPGSQTFVQCTVEADVCSPPQNLVGSFDSMSGLAHLSWTNPQAYTELRLLRDGALVAVLAGSDTAYSEVLAPGQHAYELFGVCDGILTTGVTASVYACGGVSGLSCIADPVAGTVALAWSNGLSYTDHEVRRDGQLIATLPGSETTLVDSIGLAVGQFSYVVSSTCAGGGAAESSCIVDYSSCLPPLAFQCTAVPSSSTAHLEWSGGRANYAVGIEIARDGVLVATLPGMATSYDEIVAPAAYAYAVTFVCTSEVFSTLLCDVDLTQVTFRRGDPNSDGTTNVADAVSLLAYLFSGGPAASCADSADVNNDGQLNIADAVSVLAYLFSGGPAPAAPFVACGTEPDEDSLDCAEYVPCQ
ncbi:MAG: fibronectin type III domain-containing protein [Planctomycetota bacterium]